MTIESDINEPTIHYSYGRQQSIIPDSRNDLNLPKESFNKNTPISPVHITKARPYATANDIPMPQEPSEISEISFPSMMLNSVKTKSEVRMFFSDEAPKISLALGPYCTPTPPRKQKQEISLERSILNERKVAAHLQHLWSTLACKDHNEGSEWNLDFHF